MDRDQLRALQAPLKEQYKADPDAALITLSATGTLGEGISCSVQTGRALAPMLIYILMAAVLLVRPSGLFPVKR